MTVELFSSKRCLEMVSSRKDLREQHGMDGFINESHFRVMKDKTDGEYLETKKRNQKKN
jgi:hypothetical protein